MTKINSKYFENTKERADDFINSFPEKLDDDWKDITHPEAKQNSTSRTFKNKETGLTIRVDPKKNGKPGFKGQDHFHIHNPNATSKKDYYLDKYGNPVAKNSRESHIVAKNKEDFDIIIREIQVRYFNHDNVITSIESKSEEFFLDKTAVPNLKYLSNKKLSDKIRPVSKRQAVATPPAGN